MLVHGCLRLHGGADDAAGGLTSLLRRRRQALQAAGAAAAPVAGPGAPAALAAPAQTRAAGAERRSRRRARCDPGGVAERSLPGRPQAHGAVFSDERHALQDSAGDLAGVRPALPALRHAQHPAAAARGAGAGRGLGQSACAHLLALDVGAQALGGLPAGFERGRHVPDHRRHLCRGAPLLHPRSRGGARGCVERLARLLVQRALLARTAGRCRRADRGVS